MSYIINNTNPFISIKLTEAGREQLAKGSLNFTYWAIGDSEINYVREEIVNNNPSDVTLSGISRIMRPFDKQPDIKSFISKGDSDPLNLINNTNIKTVKAIVNNVADERGFSVLIQLIHHLILILEVHIFHLTELLQTLKLAVVLHFQLELVLQERLEIISYLD